MFDQMPFEKGDIVWVHVERRHPSLLRHPAIIWQETVEDNEDFFGIMLTHTEPNGRFDNIALGDNHFQSGFDVVNDSTHFVNQLFIKFNGWGPFYKCGELSPEGVEFVTNNLSNLEPLEFEHYRQR